LFSHIRRQTRQALGGGRALGCHCGPSTLAPDPCYHVRYRSPTAYQVQLTMTRRPHGVSTDFVTWLPTTDQHRLESSPPQCRRRCPRPHSVLRARCLVKYCPGCARRKIASQWRARGRRAAGLPGSAAAGSPKAVVYFNFTSCRVPWSCACSHPDWLYL
jgi:hypothetical protein